MQKSTPAIGTPVRVRRQRWRVADVRQYDDCALVTLVGATPLGSDRALRVLTPFDEVESIASGRKVRTTTAIPWRRTLRRVLATARPADALVAAAHSRIELLPHQLEPVLAIVRGVGTRVLIADDVGLGKTIEAGLVIAELLERAAADRVLILAPAGLRDQWVEELTERFALAPSLVDVAWVNARRAQLPPGVNPWTTESLVIASIDYVKRLEVLPALSSCRWDVVVVDEAHNALTGDRFEAIARLSADAPYLLLLTATPHNGDREAFAALCGIGSRGDRLLVFRRTRRDVGVSRTRRIHRVKIRATAAERAVGQALERFAAAVRAEHGGEQAGAALALAVLRKRACSSTFSLARTVARRLDALDGQRTAAAVQPLLRFDDPDSSEDDDRGLEWTCPPLADPEHERSLLARVAEAARAAQPHQSKVGALRRLLARIREPVLVYTEYRDTLEHLREIVLPGAAAIHGGLAREERRRAVADFRAGRAAVMLATDAAGEGLNLHERCRVVVNFELPWNPTRLEQRIGRVDRIGQRRTVHAFHFVAADLGERVVVERLETRVARAAHDIRTSNPLVSEDEHDPALPAGAATDRIDAIPEHRSLVLRRALLEVEARPKTRSRQDAPEAGSTLVRRARRSSLRAALRQAAVGIVVLQLVDDTGRSVASHVTAVRVPGMTRISVRSRADARALASALERIDFSHLDPSASHWLERSRAAYERFWTVRLEREHRLHAVSTRAAPGLAQRSLFDRRADRDQAAAAAARGENAVRGRARLAAIERRRVLSLRQSAELILLP